MSVSYLVVQKRLENRKSSQQNQLPSQDLLTDPLTDPFSSNRPLLLESPATNVIDPEILERAFQEMPMSLLSCLLYRSKERTVKLPGASLQSSSYPLLC